MNMRLGRRAALAATLLPLAARRARGAWPDRPIRLIVPFPAGSATDTLPRPGGAAVARSTSPW